MTHPEHASLPLDRLLESASLVEFSILQNVIRASTSPRILLADIDETYYLCNIKWYEHLMRLLHQQYSDHPKFNPKLTYEQTLSFGYVSSAIRDMIGDEVATLLFNQIRHDPLVHSNLQLIDPQAPAIIQEHQHLHHPD